MVTRMMTAAEPWGEFPWRGSLERDATKETGCTVKKKGVDCTEPHQGSGVSSPTRKVMLVREVGKMDE